MFSKNQEEHSRKSGSTVRAFVYLMGEVYCVASFDKERIIIGRSPELDLVLNCTTVSRIHAMLSIENDSLVIEDLDSKNGVWVAGRAVRKTLIKSWEPVGVGSFVLRFHLARTRVQASSDSPRPHTDDEYTVEDEALSDGAYCKNAPSDNDVFGGMGLKKEITKVTKAPRKRLTSGLHAPMHKRKDDFKID